MIVVFLAARGYGEVRPHPRLQIDNRLLSQIRAVRHAREPAAVMPAIDRVDTADGYGDLIHTGGREYLVVFNKGTLDPARIVR